LAVTASSFARIFCLVWVVFAVGQSAASEGDAAPLGSASLSLGADELYARLFLGGESSYLGLDFEAQDEAAGLGACISLGSYREKGAGIVAGPGSASGDARVLIDPTSPTALSTGPLVELDRSFQSRCAVLGLGAGPLSFFGLAKGKGPIVFAARSGPAAQAEAEKDGAARELSAAAAGLSFGYSGPEGLALRALAAASYGGGPAAPSGWRPDPSAAPAFNAGDDSLARLSAGLIAERSELHKASLFALAASYGRLAGPGIALRLESRKTKGPFSLRIAAGASSPNFRELAGPRQERLLDACAEARLAMRRSSSLSASIETQAKGASLLYAPTWGNKGSLKLSLPVGAEDSLLETRLDADSPSEGVRGGSWSFALIRKSEAESAESSMRFGGSLRWDSSLALFGLDLKTEITGEGGLPALGLELSLVLFDKGKLDSPVIATGGASLEFPFGAGASLELEASLPEKGIILAPSNRESKAAPLVFCLRYRALL